MTVHEINSLDQLDKLMFEQVKNFSERQIVLLEGPLGSGKTQSVRYIVKHLSGGDICSPSFAIHNIYETPALDIDHVDLYRLEDEDDIESTGFWDLFEKEKGLILIEWANYIDESLMPVYWRRTRFSFEVAGESRKLAITQVK